MRPTSLAMVLLFACTGETADDSDTRPQGELVGETCVYPLDCGSGCDDLATDLAGQRNANHDQGGGYELWRCGEGSSWEIRSWWDDYFFEVYYSYYDADGTMAAYATSYDCTQDCGDEGRAFSVRYGEAPACEANCLYETSGTGTPTCTGGSPPPGVSAP